jgi:serine/threonine protein kinase
MKSSEGTHEKESIMSNIPLLLEKRKNGIVE